MLERLILESLIVVSKAKKGYYAPQAFYEHNVVVR
jgi:hypothetical protein